MSASLTVGDLKRTDISSLSELRGQKVCYVPGYYEGFMAKEGRYVTGVQVKTISDCILQLNSGGVDAILYDKPLLDQYAEKGWLGKTSVVSNVILETKYGIAFPEGSDLTSRISAAILALSQMGTFMEDVHLRYLGDVKDKATDAQDEEINWATLIACSSGFAWIVLAKLTKMANKVRRGKYPMRMFKSHGAHKDKEDDHEHEESAVATMHALKQSLDEMRLDLKDMREQVSRNQQELLAKVEQSDGAQLVSREVSRVNKLDL